MRLVSFENDLNSLRLALTYNRDFLYLRHGGPAGILESGRWQSQQFPGLSWELVTGDFLENLAGPLPAPDVIFYDPFSRKADGPMWTLDTFRKVRAACNGGPVELFTYSASTAVRGALLVAGFHVAKGRPIADRPETTVAFTAPAPGPERELLGREWLSKWRRSGAKIPDAIPDDEKAAFEAAIIGHPQFGA
jgi:queuine tRNA-ribosyltransferase